MSEKYPARQMPQKPVDHLKVGPQEAREEDKVKIYQDGTVEVINLKEVSTDGLSYGLNEKRDNFNFTYDLDANTEVQFVPKYVDKVYSTTVTKSFSIKKAFAVYRDNVKKFVTQNLTRYRTSSKALKKKVDSILKDKNEFIWTNQRGDSFWNQVYIDNTTFGPYNYDVTISASRDINFINDLLVIKTGHKRAFYDRFLKRVVNVAGTSNVLWVSPHEVFNYSGAGSYISTGPTITSVKMDPDYIGGADEYMWGTDWNVTNHYDAFALSSKNVRIEKGTQFKTEFSYQYGKGSSRKGRRIPLQHFHETYNEYRANSYTGVWDGIVPSGHFIELQTWSTNPKHIGFDGEISIKPVDTALSENIDLSCDVTCTVEDKDYQVSVRKAVEKAKRKFYKKINVYLIKNGIKPKPAKYRRYEQLLERIAQNVYGGLGFIRNENIAKVQGLESNPLDSPIYYDGTSLEYGGSNQNLNYKNTTATNPLKTPVQGSETTY